WTLYPNFSPSEWPAGVLANMDARLIPALQRARTESGVRVKPSPVPGAHVRATGPSRHSIQGGARLSDATDLFIPGGWSDALAFWQAAQRDPEIGGIGLYINRQWGGPMPMIHIDLRPQRLLWLCRRHPITDKD